ncbi:trypsin-like serine protease [Streptomyces sp. NBC_01591]|uniref:trypsin-like serine protease n=1 Tax=Streptomyces sp. NBC_01591 TaxID=2975888 RepID=UPI003FA37791
MPVTRSSSRPTASTAQRPASWRCDGAAPTGTISPPPAKSRRSPSTPRFDTNTLVADVAVITLQTAALQQGGVQFARLASQDPAPGTQFTVTGWGATGPDTPTLSTTLQAIQEKADTPAGCRSQVGDALQDGMFCGRPAPGQGTCKGDSGAPAAADGTVFGMATSRISPCGNGTDDVYTSTAAYKTWIESQ